MTLYIAGAGGLGREALDAAFQASAISGSGDPAADLVFVDEWPAAAAVGGIPVLRPADLGGGTGRFLVAIADPEARCRLAGLLEERGLIAATVVHPRAVVSPDSRIEPGCLVLANAVVSVGARIGRHSQVHYTATVGHDSRLAEYTTVLPGANIAGSVELGARATVGSNACVLPGRRIGARAFVGAGAVVTRDQPPGAVAVGVPARPRPSTRSEEGLPWAPSWS